MLFVERQIAHAWAAGVAASIAMFWIECGSRTLPGRLVALARGWRSRPVW